MIKKALATFVLAVVAVFAVPMAASAYVPDDQVTVTGSAVPGGTVTVTIDEAFSAGEDVSFSVTGEEGFTLATFKLAPATNTITKTASADGSASVAIGLPEDATGTYTVTATGLTSGTVATAAVTVSAADGGAADPGTDDGLPVTGGEISMLTVWIAAGALLLGAALISTMIIVRRQRASQN